MYMVMLTMQEGLLMHMHMHMHMLMHMHMHICVYVVYVGTTKQGHGTTSRVRT